MRFLRRLFAKLRTRRSLNRLLRTKGDEVAAIRFSGVAAKSRYDHERLSRFSSLSLSTTTVSATPAGGDSLRDARWSAMVWSSDFFSPTSDRDRASLGFPRRSSSCMGFTPRRHSGLLLPTTPTAEESTCCLDPFSPCYASKQCQHAEADHADGQSGRRRGDSFEMWDYVHPQFVRHDSLNEWI